MLLKLVISEAMNCLRKTLRSRLIVLGTIHTQRRLYEGGRGINDPYLLRNYSDSFNGSFRLCLPSISITFLETSLTLDPTCPVSTDWESKSFCAFFTFKGFVGLKGFEIICYFSHDFIMELKCFWGLFGLNCLPPFLPHNRKDCKKG